MQIEYVATRSRREVDDRIGKRLIERKIARAVYQARELDAESAVDPASEIEVEISPRTGKPKRQYKRRDMQPE